VPLLRKTLAVPLVIAIAAGATWAGASAAEPTARSARLADFPTFVFATIAQGDLRGSVAAVQRSATPRAAIFTSLHGLSPGKTYRGMITDLPCGRNATGADSILDLVGLRKTDAGEDDFFEQKTGRLSERLARGRTVRLYEEGRQVACARANRVR
jgi:hypothetical protein